jgi:hypothetical protein
MLTEQDMMTPNQTLLGTMSSSATYKTMTGAEEKIHVIIRQTGESRESQLFIERNPVGVMVIRPGR